MREETRPQPVSPYGVTKLAAENLCWLYWKNYNVPTISLRYFTVYGPRQRPDMAISKFVSAIKNGTPITIFGEGYQTRDFTYISDIVDANLLAAQYPKHGDIFNIGGGNRISVNGLIKEIEEAGKKKAIVRYTKFQKGDALDTLADTTKAREQLGWKPRVSISKGIEKYLRGYITGVV